MPKHGKKFRQSATKVEHRPYALEEAIELARDAAFVKFDETLEIAMRLGVDPKHADQMVRGTVVLPHGLGTVSRVLVFATGDKVREAEEAGADVVGGEELAKRIEGGWLEFDSVVATPDMMRVVGRLGKVLGPRGLMPNPKAGTVTLDVAKAVQEIKAGKVEFRVDKTGIIHAPDRQAVLRHRPASGERRGPHRRGAEGEAQRGQGQVCAGSLPSPRRWAPASRWTTPPSPPSRPRSTVEEISTMPLTRSDKEQILEQYENGLAKAPHAFLFGFQGITVPQVTELRNRVRNSGGEYVVVKNTLALRAIDSKALAQLKEHFVGPTAVVFSAKDPVALAKALTDFGQGHAGPRVQGRPGRGPGHRGRRRSRTIASLPSREELVAKLLFLMQSPIAASCGCWRPGSAAARVGAGPGAEEEEEPEEQA